LVFSTHTRPSFLSDSDIEPNRLAVIALPRNAGWVNLRKTGIGHQRTVFVRPPGLRSIHIALSKIDNTLRHRPETPFTCAGVRLNTGNQVA
jgi:hypothetical protein